MARRRNLKEHVQLKATISSRLLEIRHEQFGEHGGPELARRLGLPPRTWYNYESGVTVPAEVVLRFIQLTNVNPRWLLTGEGQPYATPPDSAALADLSGEELIRRGLEKLEQTWRRPTGALRPPADRAAADRLARGDLIAIPLARGLDDLGAVDAGRVDPEDYIYGFRTWVAHPEQTVCVRMTDSAMHPVLPCGSIVAIDCAQTEPRAVQGQIGVVRTEAGPLVRWVEVSGSFVILRAQDPAAGGATQAVDLREGGQSPILGKVIWSWSRFEPPTSTWDLRVKTEEPMCHL